MARKTIVNTYSTGRCANGAQRDAGRLTHAIVDGAGEWQKALCGFRPGRRSNGWSDYRADECTCKKCAAILEDTAYAIPA